MSRKSTRDIPAKSLKALGLSPHYCEGCECTDELVTSPVIDPGAAEPTEWCSLCISLMPADVLDHYFPNHNDPAWIAEQRKSLRRLKRKNARAEAVSDSCGTHQASRAKHISRHTVAEAMGAEPNLTGAEVYIVLTIGTTDLEVLDQAPRWDLRELNQICYVANINGGDSAFWGPGPSMQDQVGDE